MTRYLSPCFENVEERRHCHGKMASSTRRLQGRNVRRHSTRNGALTLNTRQGSNAVCMIPVPVGRMIALFQVGSRGDIRRPKSEGFRCKRGSRLEPSTERAFGAPALNLPLN